MKIRKVEISAFRAFNNVEDATFDFTLRNDEVADFISIYAPNGYGKTSFYDAVEWCVTGQIERFHRNRIEYEKLAKENRKAAKENPFFLQNNNQKEILGSVNVYTTKKTFNKKLTNSKVYDFRQKTSEIYFKDVILSQDLIDAFIKEDKADERYDKFIESITSLENYNNALKNVVKLTENTFEKIKSLKKSKKKIKEVKLNLDYKGDENIIEEINKAILKLIDQKEIISLIKKDKFTKNEYNVFTQKINSELVSLEIEIDALNTQVRNIDNSFNGIKSEEIRIGISKYHELIKKNKQYIDQKNELKITLKSIIEKNRLEKLLFDSTNELEKILKANGDSIKIKSDFPFFSKIESNIILLKKEIEGLNLELEKNNVQHRELIKDESNLIIELNKQQSDLDLKVIKIKEFPTKKAELKGITKQNNEVIISIRNLKKTIDRNNKELEIINLELDECKYFELKFVEDPEILLDYDPFNNFRSKINQILELQKEQKNINERIFELDEKIKAHEELNVELENFISLGLALVTKNESSSCPLCTYQYRTFNELSNIISNNEHLGSLLKSSLLERSKFVLKKKSIITKIKYNSELIEAFIKRRFESIEVSKQKNYLKTEKLNKALKEKIGFQSKLKNEKKEASSFFEELDTDIFEKKIKNEIAALKKEVESKSLLLKNIKSTIESFISTNDKLNNRVLLLKKEIKEERKKDVYVAVINYFNQYIKSNIIDIGLLEKEIEGNKKKILGLKKINNNYKRGIKIKNESLAKNVYTKEELIKKIERIEKSEMLNENIIQNYEQLIKTEFQINLKQLSNDEIKRNFENIKLKEKSELKEKKELQKYYRILDKLKDNTYKFLESEKTKNEILGLEKEIKNQSIIKSKLDKEKESLESFLKKSVDAFFYTKLINKIYQKIDPHPEYSEIEFDCDFTEKNPRLIIYTIDKEGNKSIPSLYFSTAQINVLSLSIFLARALKAKNIKTGETVDCIFIDDPIQSMDSINILSFIDLFRSIILTFKKQIIVSSHEENFHLLLQKKIPPNLFKSKFINFETFGKLKKDINISTN